MLNIIVKNNADCVFIFCRAKFKKLKSFAQRFFGFTSVIIIFFTVIVNMMNNWKGSEQMLSYFHPRFNLKSFIDSNLDRPVYV